MRATVPQQRAFARAVVGMAIECGLTNVGGLRSRLIDIVSAVQETSPARLECQSDGYDVIVTAMSGQPDEILLSSFQETLPA